MISGTPAVTICIRTLNEADLLGTCLEKVFSQECTWPFEVLIIDSGSTDGTLEIAQRFPVRIHGIPKEQFHYAETLNTGVRLSKGTFFVPLSGHAIPVDCRWLQSLVTTVAADPLIAGAFSQQVPGAACDPYERAFLPKLHPPHAVPEITNEDANLYDSFAVVFSNVSSCMRTSLLTEVPFRKVPRCEDRLWATEVLRRGQRIVYVPESCVTHSHDSSPLDYYKVARLNGITSEIVDGPLRDPIARFLHPAAYHWIVRLLDTLVRGTKQHGALPAIGWLTGRYGNAIAFRLGTLAGLREGWLVAGHGTRTAS